MTRSSSSRWTHADLTTWELQPPLTEPAGFGQLEVPQVRGVAAPKLFAAALVRQRDGTWAFVGFLNQEPEGSLSFEILDPIPVGLRDGAPQGL